MPTTYSNLLRLAKQATGENDGTWGTIANENVFELLEDAIAKIEEVTVTAGNITLTTNDGSSDQARAAGLKFIGTPGTTRTITIPTSTKIYILDNATTDDSEIIITTGSGSTVTLLNGQISIVYCDGTEVRKTTSLDAKANLSDIDDAPTARTNLGLGELATLDLADLPSGAIIGEIKQWTTDTAPTGYLSCDGAAISRTTYSDLFSVIGVTYGSGDGSTTFNIPDGRARSPLGFGQGLTAEGDATGTDRSIGDIGGYETHSLTEDENAEHTHGIGQNFSIGTVDEPNNEYSGVDDSEVQQSTASGSGDPHNNMHPFFVVNYIIFTGV